MNYTRWLEIKKKIITTVIKITAKNHCSKLIQWKKSLQVPWVTAKISCSDFYSEKSLQKITAVIFAVKNDCKMTVSTATVTFTVIFLRAKNHCSDFYSEKSL